MCNDMSKQPRRWMQAALVAMGVALAGCQTDKVAEVPEDEDVYDDRFQISTLVGILQTRPDEFSVLTKRPLEMPQDFAALPAPEPGKISTREPNPQADARAALAFEPVPASTGASAPSATEAAILSSAGPVDPTIRSTLVSEQAAYDSEQNLYFLDRVFPRLREARGDLYPEAINAEAERQRLIQSGISAQPTGGVASIPTGAAPLQSAPAPSLGGVLPPRTVPAPVVASPAPTILSPAPAAPAGATQELIFLPQ